MQHIPLTDCIILDCLRSLQTSKTDLAQDYNFTRLRCPALKGSPMAPKSIALLLCGLLAMLCGPHLASGTGPTRLL